MTDMTTDRLCSPTSGYYVKRHKQAIMHDLRIICIKLKLCPIGISSLRLENASLTLFGERVTPAVQRYHVDPDGQADGQSLWLLILTQSYRFEIAGLVLLVVRDHSFMNACSCKMRHLFTCFDF